MEHIEQVTGMNHNSIKEICDESFEETYPDPSKDDDTMDAWYSEMEETILKICKKHGCDSLQIKT